VGEQEISSIESEMEQTRARLASTIDQLVHRASPKTIARREINSLKGFFVDPQGAPRRGNIAKVAAGAVGLVAVVVTIRAIVK